MPRDLATSSGPVSQCSAPRLMSFHGAALARKVSWQERNSSRSSGVAMPEALKKSSYWRIRCARASSLSPFGAMQ